MSIIKFVNICKETFFYDSFPWWFLDMSMIVFLAQNFNLHLNSTFSLLHLLERLFNIDLCNNLPHYITAKQSPQKKFSPMLQIICLSQVVKSDLIWLSWVPFSTLLFSPFHQASSFLPRIFPSWPSLPSSAQFPSLSQNVFFFLSQSE